jgi:hypothetical protein
MQHDQAHFGWSCSDDKMAMPRMFHGVVLARVVGLGLQTKGYLLLSVSRRYYGLTSSAPAAVVAKATYLDTRFSATSRQSDVLSGVADHLGVSSISVVANSNPSTQDG